ADEELVETVDILAAPRTQRQVMKPDPPAGMHGALLLGCRRVDADDRVGVRPDDLVLVRNAPEAELRQDRVVERRRALEVVDGEIHVIRPEHLDGHYFPRFLRRGPEP